MLLNKHITFDFLKSIEAVNEILFEWKARTIERGMIVGDFEVKKKAMSLAEFFNVGKFNASDKWLSRFNSAFKKRLTFRKRKRSEEENILETENILTAIRKRLHSDTYERFMSYIRQTEKMHSTSNDSSNFKRLKQASLTDLLIATPARFECAIQKELTEKEVNKDNITFCEVIDVDESSRDSDVVEIKVPAVVVDITEDDDDINQQRNVLVDQNEFARSCNRFRMLKDEQKYSETEIVVLEDMELSGTFENEKDCDKVWETFFKNYDETNANGHERTNITVTGIKMQQLAVEKDCDEYKTDHKISTENESQLSDKVDVFQLIEYCSDDEATETAEHDVKTQQSIESKMYTEKLALSESQTGSVEVLHFIRGNQNGGFSRTLAAEHATVIQSSVADYTQQTPAPRHG